MLKVMITAACMVALIIGAASAATPVANWPYQANQGIRPQPVLVTNTCTATGFDTSASATTDTIDLGAVYNTIVITTDTDAVVSLSYCADSASGDYLPAGSIMKLDYQARYLWVMTRSGLAAAFPTAIRVRGIH